MAKITEVYMVVDGQQTRFTMNEYKVLVGRNKKIVFQLINGLELTGSEGNNDGEK